MQRKFSTEFSNLIFCSIDEIIQDDNSSVYAKSKNPSLSKKKQIDSFSSGIISLRTVKRQTFQDIQSIDFNPQIKYNNPQSFQLLSFPFQYQNQKNSSQSSDFDHLFGLINLNTKKEGQQINLMPDEFLNCQVQKKQKKVSQKKKIFYQGQLQVEISSAVDQTFVGTIYANQDNKKDKYILRIYKNQEEFCRFRISAKQYQILSFKNQVYCQDAQIWSVQDYQWAFSCQISIRLFKDYTKK